MIVSWGFARLCLVLSALFMTTTEGNSWSEEISERLGKDVSAGGYVDQETCHGALFKADADGDRRVDSDEYVTFVQLLEPGFAEDANSIEDLSRQLRQAFNLLACLCTLNGSDDDCCVGDNAHLSNVGTAPGETPTSDQDVYLYSICLTTANAIDRTIGTSSPTLSPSASPSEVTNFPTFRPSASPSSSPTSVVPITPLPTTLKPVTVSPTSSRPTTRQPTTFPPHSRTPTTVRPVTQAPTTVRPITKAPSTVLPITPAPTTVRPITTVPTTFRPTTDAPTTLSPNTAAPTTSSPITQAPTTLIPITQPPTAAPSTPGVSVIPTLTESPAAPVTPSTETPVAPGTPSSETPTSVAPVTSTVPTTVTPSATPTDFVVFVEYNVEFKNGKQTGSEEELEEAMKLLAQQVAGESFPARRVRRLLGQRRRLSVDVETTEVVNATNLECPSTCESIVHSITLNIVNEEDVQSILTKFIEEMQNAIAEGRLQETLTSNNPSTNVVVVTSSGATSTPTASPQDASGLSAGATAGIVIGALGALALIGIALFAMRRKNNGDKGEDAYFPTGMSTSQTLATPQDVEGEIAGPGDGTLGAREAEYRVASKASAAALVEGEIADKAAPQDEKGADSSSNAGSSGWSSSVGNSTLNSESIDGMDEATGSSLAAIGAASALVASRGTKDVSGVPVVPDVTREDLDLAIEAGDWAAVGATAALLAAASDSQSASSRSRASTSRGGGGSSISSLDAARAAELDHLVDAGDWEGVVVAAAKFESIEDLSKSSSQNSRTGGSSGAASTTLSDSPSKVAKRDEIRDEVESLVRRVVPEEIDNVDEMMLQFKGREEELVETLRTMQERQVAQKARVQGQKQAKRDARRVAQEGGLSLPVPPAASSAAIASPPPGGAEVDTQGVGAIIVGGVAVGVAAVSGVAAAVGMASRNDDDDMDQTSTTSGSSSDASESFFSTPTKVPSMLGVIGKSDRSRSSSTDDEDDAMASKKRRTALELAIEAGDWEAVGEAAAMMSDASVNSASTGEIHRMAEGDISGGASEEDRNKINSDRAAELDEMIDRGDWTGVVAAASRFSATEISPTPRDSSPNSSGDVPELITSSEREKQLREEQDALAQADLWMEIAQQSKLEGSTDAAASDAADWAIARSLSALKSAEAKGDLVKQDSDEGSADSGKSV